MNALQFPRPDPGSRMTLAVLVVWVTILVLAMILGSLKAAWWQIGLMVVLVWLVRVTARREVL